MSTPEIAAALQSAITDVITPTSAPPQLRTVGQAPPLPDVTDNLIGIFDKELARAQIGQDRSALVGAYQDASKKVGAADGAVGTAVKTAALNMKAVDTGQLDAAIALERQALATPNLDASSQIMDAQRDLASKQAAIADAQRVARQKIIKETGVDSSQADSLITQELNRVANLRISIQNQEKSVIGQAFAALLSGGRAGADQNGNIVGLTGIDATQKQIDASYSAIRAATTAANQAIPFAEMVAADSLGGAVDEQRKLALTKATDDYNKAQNAIRAGKISEARVNTILADTSYSRDYGRAKDQGNLLIQAAQANAGAVKSMADYAIGAAKASIEKNGSILSALSSRIAISERQDKQAMEANALYVANTKRVQLGMEAITPAAFKMMQPKEKQQVMDQGASVAFGGTFDEAMGMIQSLGFNPERMKQEGNGKDAAQLQLFQQAVQKELSEVMAVGPDGVPKNLETHAAFKKLTPEQRVRAVSAKLQDDWDFQAKDMSQAAEDNPRKINFKTYAMLVGTRPELVKPLMEAGVADEIIKMNGPENINKKDVLPRAFDALLGRVQANPAGMDLEVKKFTDTFSMLTRLQAATSGYPQYGMAFDGDYKVNLGGSGKKARVISFTNPAQIKAMLATESLRVTPISEYSTIPGMMPQPLLQDTRTNIQRLADDN